MQSSQAGIVIPDGPFGRLGEASLPPVQVKQQQATISVDGLRSFLAVLGDDDVGLFVSLGGFTKDGAPPI